MKHKWEIKPRGKLTKYYVCSICNMTVVATSKKLADKLEPFCIFGFNRSFKKRKIPNPSVAANPSYVTLGMSKKEIKRLEETGGK